MSDTRRWLSTAIVEAVRSDRDVRLVECDGLLGVSVDDEVLVRLPSETFDWPIDDLQLDADEEAVLEGVWADVEARRRRTRRERERERTEAHRAAEGATMGGEP